MKSSRADLSTIVQRARTTPPTPEQRDRLGRDFVFANVAIENPRVTREMVDRVFDERAGQR